jgi:hypothetical protein
MNQTPSVPEPAPGTYIPTEMPPLDVPQGPDQPIEIDQPPPTEPSIPIREPGIHVPARAAWRKQQGSVRLQSRAVNGL